MLALLTSMKETRLSQDGTEQILMRTHNDLLTVITSDAEKPGEVICLGSPVVLGEELEDGF